MSDSFSISTIDQLMKSCNDKAKQLNSSEYNKTGLLPIVDQGKELICGYTDDIEKKYDKGIPVIIFGDHTLQTKYIDFDFAIGADGTQLIAPKGKHIDIRYLFYVVYRAGNIIGSEGYKRHLKILKEFKTPYTNNQKEQKKIAAILTSVDAVIEKTAAQISKLRDLKKAMMTELLTKGIGHTEFKDSSVGRIPAAWEVSDLKTKCKRITDGTHQAVKVSKDGEIPFLYISCINDGQILWDKSASITEAEYLIASKGRKPMIGDLLYTAVGSYGQAVVVDVEKQFSFQRHIAFIQPKQDELWSDYLCWYLNSPLGKKQADRLAVGNAQLTVTLGDLSKLAILLPKLEEQKKISAILTSIQGKIIKVKIKLDHQKTLKKALMHDLLTGKKRVKVVVD